ncbi:MAG: acyltransferase family protein [Sphingobium sp.]
MVLPIIFEMWGRYVKVYRTDIDGLRSLAILPVVLFHAGFSAFPGGFVGVDVFFVISGFLITSSLMDDIDAGKYSIASFYERRIRRIFPAFIAVIAAVALLGFSLQLPDDLKDLGTSIWAACLFVSNISFWMGSGDYFGTKSEFQPLLHTWSLSVEEQFYIFFPIFLFVAVKLGRRYVMPLLIVSVFLLSLGASIVATQMSPVANFYLLPTRAWELLAGSLLAIGIIPVPGRKVQAEVEALAGLALIILPVFLYNSRTAFPGLTAIPPVLGAALVIHAGMANHQTFVANLLSRPVPRFFGLISYSLYLWHWPVIVFSRYYLLELGLVQSFAIVAGSTLLATLSWRYVERPFRKRDAVFTRAPLFAATAALLLLASGTGLVFARNGLPYRVPADIIQMADKKSYHGPWRACGGTYQRRATLEEVCVKGAAGARPDLLIVGDSHAEALAAATFEAAARLGRSGFQVTDTGYRPTLGYEKVGEEKKYHYLNKLVIDLLTRNPQVKDVIVPAYWHQAAGIDQYRDADGRVVSGVAGMEAGLGLLAARYPDKQFLLVLPAAHSLAFGGSALARATWYGRLPFQPVVERAVFDAEAREYAAAINALKRYPNIRTFGLDQYFCDRSICRGSMNGLSLYSDDNHLSYAASRMAVPDFVNFLSSRMGRAEAGKQIVTLQ